MDQVDLLNIAALAQSFVLALLLFRQRQLENALRDHALQLGAVRERAGVDDEDVDAYHDRVHPECAGRDGGR